jgi:predicted PurR-regulated permease PerM
VFFVIWIAYLTRQILLILFVSLILSSLIDPFADWFQQRRIPRGLAAIVVYIVIAAILTLMAAVLVPTILEQAHELAKNFGFLWQSALDKLGFLGDLARRYNIIPTDASLFSALKPGASQTVQGIFSTIGGFFAGVASVVLTAALTFYMVIEEDAMRKAMRHLAPDHYQPLLNRILHRIREKLGAWGRGQIILSLLIGVLEFIGLTILGVQYAAVLALLGAVGELVPYVGALIVGTVAIFLAFTQTGTYFLPLMVLILMIVVQQTENHLIVPKVMQRAVGLNPIISIIALLVGAQLAGFIGIFLAIPVATSLSVIIQELAQKEV